MSRGFPYRRPTKDVVRARPWVLHTARGDEPLPGLLPSWDYGTDLSLSRRVRIDVPRLFADAGLEDIALLVGVYWSAGRLRGTGSVEEVAPSVAVVDVVLSADLRGWELGGTLALHSVVAVAREGARVTAPLAWRPGSILWDDDKRTKLQGDVPRFPVAVVDIGAQGYPAASSWILDVNADLHEPTLGALHLLVNEDDAMAVRAVTAAGSDDEVAQLLLSSIHYDVGRTLVDLAVGHEELDEDREFPAESLGRTLQALLRRVFPGASISAVRDMRTTDPSRYSGEILAALRPSARI